jgi:hypothetical protein
MSEAPLVSEVFPEFAAELESLLKSKGEALVTQIPGLRIVERCHCGDDFCATVYTVPKPKGTWGLDYRGIDLGASSGMIILGVLKDKIAEIEILYRDEIRNKLNILIPLAKRK